MIMLCQITVCFGLYSYHKNRKQTTILPYIEGFVFISVLIVLEVRHQIFLSEKIDINCRQSVKYKNFTRNELREFTQCQKQRVIVVLDDLVVDCTDFAAYHPGGCQLINSLAGQDITAQFYGSVEIYDNEGNRIERHLHSNYAKIVVKSLILGKLSVGPKLETAMRVVKTEPICDKSTTAKVHLQIIKASDVSSPDTTQTLGPLDQK